MIKAALLLCMPLVLCTAVCGQSVGPVAHYPFDGNADDASGNGYHGTVFGAVLVPDRFGNPGMAYEFDGVDDYIKAPASGLPTGERTTMLWFFADSLSTQPVLLGYGGNGPTGTSWFLDIACCGSPSYAVRLHWPGSFFLESLYAQPPLDKWHHFAASTSVAGTRLYVDGVELATDPFFVDNTFVAGTDLAIGVDVSGFGIAPFQNGDVGYFDGRIDDVRIYDRALTPSEIAALAEVETGPAVVTGSVKISNGHGGFAGTLLPGDVFGTGLCGIADLNDDGWDDMVVGASRDSLAGFYKGAVWVLFLDGEGQVIGHQRIAEGEGGLLGTLIPEGEFGSAVVPLDDWNDNGYPELIVGQHQEYPVPGTWRGKIWILELDAGGVVTAESSFGPQDLETANPFLKVADFGESLAAPGDLNGDDIDDVIVGSPGYQGYRGAIWLICLDGRGGWLSHTRISDGVGGLPAGTLVGDDRFGESVEVLGDVNGDGIDDLAVGATRANHAPETGAVFILFMDGSGGVLSVHEIGDGVGGFTGTLIGDAEFGRSLAALGDVDGDGVPDMAVGAVQDADGGLVTGALWVVCLNADGTVKSQAKLGLVNGCIDGEIEPGDGIGYDLALLSGAGTTHPVLATGALGDDDGGPSCGAAWRLEVDLAPPDPWQVIEAAGAPCAGTSGDPVLTGSGLLLASCPASLQLANALPAADAWLVVGFTPLQAPFKQCLLVPSVDLLIGPLPVNAQGGLTLATTWPTGIPAGVETLFQWWIQDPLGPAGFATSNGLVGTTP